MTEYEHPYEQARREIVASLLPAGEGRLALDVGCGPGVYSRLLAEAGWRVEAVDADAENLQHAQAAATYPGDAVDILPTLPERRFDLVLALEIIEHMPLARGETLLREIRRVLAPGGTLILSTPNRFSPEGLVGYYLNEKIRHARAWQAWDPSHVHIYSSPEILRLLRRAGFSIVSVTGYWYETRLSWLGRVALPLVSTRRFPLNRFGFQLIVESRR